MPVKLLSFLSFSVIFVYLFVFGFVVDLGLSVCLLDEWYSFGWFRPLPNEVVQTNVKQR